MIRLEQVSKLYPAKADDRNGATTVRALDAVTLHVAPAEWVAVMGPSGSGKSTLVNLIGCLDRPTNGTVVIDGEPVSALAESQLNRIRAEKVGFVFQQFHLVPYLTTLENVMLAQYFHSMTDEREAREALEKVGLGDRANHLPAQLSGGEQQRACIARALINDPRIILADEPTGNLDARNQEIVLALLRDLHRQGRTIVMVTHDSDMARLADRTIRLHHGRVVDERSFAKDDREQFDELLEEIWTTLEQGQTAESGRLTAPGALPVSFALEAMAEMSLVTLRRHPPHAHEHKPLDDRCHASLGRPPAPAGDGPTIVEFTERGRQRAEDLVRRHRLAEQLLTTVLQVGDRAEVEREACKFEHVLSESAADHICSMLGHPSTCPHGAPIPRGRCCVNQGAITLAR